jgi:hypothetical protein
MTNFAGMFSFQSEPVGRDRCLIYILDFRMITNTVDMTIIAK